MKRAKVLQKIFSIFFLVIFIMILSKSSYAQKNEQNKQMCDIENFIDQLPKQIKYVIENIEPLQHDRGDIMPIFAWQLNFSLDQLSDQKVKTVLNELDKRGFGWCHIWNNNKKEDSVKEGVRVGKIQKQLNLTVNINANYPLHHFFNGDQSTAHIDKSGENFFDNSFGYKYMGCPFALEGRYDDIKNRIEFFVNGYKDAGVEIDFVFADWEVDGPIEWNNAWDNSKKCVRCINNIEDINDFSQFQAQLRKIRSDMQKKTYADVIINSFPQALVGNYAVYPHDGWRYWYDYFEKLPEDAPYKKDQNAKYRPWYPEFSETGYTFAMPTVYTWYEIFDWYNFEDTDYRWFYNMLLVASNAAKSTDHSIPIISHVHWHTTVTPPDADGHVKQFSKEKYKELLWHMLLRGHDVFISWCLAEEFPEEINLIHDVYSKALQYSEFIKNGKPINFNVPDEPGLVVSGLRIKDEILVRWTAFADTKEKFVEIEGQKFDMRSGLGKCHIVKIK